LIESAGADNRRYLEALGVVLVHELARLNPATPHVRTPHPGGLAAWQQRCRDHLYRGASCRADIARHACPVVRLSPYYFCRAFKQSFGIPPHRFHTMRRIERAKALLAKPAPSVTEIGLAVGFSETSSFTAAFRKATGFTPDRLSPKLRIISREVTRFRPSSFGKPAERTVWLWRFHQSIDRADVPASYLTGGLRRMLGRSRSRGELAARPLTLRRALQTGGRALASFALALGVLVFAAYFQLSQVQAEEHSHPASRRTLFTKGSIHRG